MSTWVETPKEFATLDYSDNEPGAIEKLLELNEFYRKNRWPSAFREIMIDGLRRP